ncbi:hypothetical protein PG985_003648 [Apiospora marii]|uniref:Zn(2)-C6 fungal-type domain-containing protein n=1 Tax=Apiospora marii TaxID=335849 RepID=A0ABR1SHH4_9PEZI
MSEGEILKRSWGCDQCRLITQLGLSTEPHECLYYVEFSDQTLWKACSLCISNGRPCWETNTTDEKLRDVDTHEVLMDQAPPPRGTVPKRNTKKYLEKVDRSYVRYNAFRYMAESLAKEYRIAFNYGDNHNHDDAAGAIRKLLLTKMEDYPFQLWKDKMWNTRGGTLSNSGQSTAQNIQYLPHVTSPPYGGNTASTGITGGDASWADADGQIPMPPTQGLGGDTSFTGNTGGDGDWTYTHAQMPMPQTLGLEGSTAFTGNPGVDENWTDPYAQMPMLPAQGPEGNAVATGEPGGYENPADIEEQVPLLPMQKLDVNTQNIENYTRINKHRKRLGEIAWECDNCFARNWPCVLIIPGGRACVTCPRGLCDSKLCDAAQSAERRRRSSLTSAERDAEDRWIRDEQRKRKNEARQRSYKKKKTPSKKENPSEKKNPSESQAPEPLDRDTDERRRQVIAVRQHNARNKQAAQASLARVERAAPISNYYQGENVYD